MGTCVLACDRALLTNARRASLRIAAAGARAFAAADTTACMMTAGRLTLARPSASHHSRNSGKSISPVPSLFIVNTVRRT